MSGQHGYVTVVLSSPRHMHINADQHGSGNRAIRLIVNRFNGDLVC